MGRPGAGLVEAFRLIRYDRRGHGKSGAPKGDYTMDMLGRDVLAVADAAGAKTFNWCGLSMGGMVGQWMGANARDRVERLVLSNTHYYYADKQPWHDRMKFAQDNGLEKLSGPQMERWFTKEFRERAPAAVNKVVADVHRYQARRLSRLLRGGARHGLPRLDPDHHRAGPGHRRQQGPGHAAEFGEAIHKMIKGSKLTSIDAAHLSNIEQPKAYADAVLNFLMQK